MDSLLKYRAYLERKLPTTDLNRTKPSGNLYSDQNAPMAESIGAFCQTMKLVQEQENFLFGLGHLGAKNERRPWDAISCERSAETAMQINYSTVKLYVAPHSVTEQESLRKSNPGPQSRGTSADWPLRAIGTPYGTIFRAGPDAGSRRTRSRLGLRTANGIQLRGG